MDEEKKPENENTEIKKEEHHEHKVHKLHHSDAVKSEKKSNLDNVLIAIGIILLIVLFVNIYTTFGINSALNKNINEAKEKAKPANIELFTIKDAKCVDCFDLSQVSASLKQSGINIVKEQDVDFSSSEGKELISKYSITKIPAVVLKGEIAKVSADGLTKKDDALLLEAPQAPYTQAKDGKIVGRVTATLFTDKTCTKCSNATALLAQIKASGVKVVSEKIVDSNSAEGKNLAKMYNLDHAPTLLLSKDAGEYALIKEAWPTAGSIEKDGTYVLRLVIPPFVNLTGNKVRGLVDVTFLSDKSCTTCQDVYVHRQILGPKGTFGMAIEKEQSFDVSDVKGKELVAKYNITSVPTVVLTGDAAVYPSLVQLKQFFSPEKDGAYVFRQPELLGVYKNLVNGSVVTPAVQEQN